MKKIVPIIIVFIIFICLSGFDTDNAIESQSEIHSGAPPKDGIPALLEPKFLKPNEAAFLEDHDQVIGLRIGGITKAYPIKILNWHEIVNDTINGIPVAVTF